MSIIKSYNNTTEKYLVTFELPIEDSLLDKEIRLVGDFNDWSWEQALPLKKHDNKFKVDIELSPSKKYEYRYLVNNQFWVNDNIADSYAPSPCDDVNNCVLVLGDPNVKSIANSSKGRTRVIDFTKIEGIDMDTKIALNDADIKTYYQLANANIETLANLCSDHHTNDTFQNWKNHAGHLDQNEW